MGIEPTSPAWKAGALPLSYSRASTTLKRVLWNDNSRKNLQKCSIRKDTSGNFVRENFDTYKVFDIAPYGAPTERIEENFALTKALECRALRRSYNKGNRNVPLTKANPVER